MLQCYSSKCQQVSYSTEYDKKFKSYFSFKSRTHQVQNYSGSEADRLIGHPLNSSFWPVGKGLPSRPLCSTQKIEQKYLNTKHFSSHFSMAVNNKNAAPLPFEEIIIGDFFSLKCQNILRSRPCPMTCLPMGQARERELEITLSNKNKFDSTITCRQYNEWQ